MEVHWDGNLKLDSSMVTIGAFDGVHRGHQALISHVCERARACGVPSVVYTFDPPPKVYFRHALQVTSIEEKIRRLGSLSVDHVIVASFNERYAARSTQLFLGELSDLNPVEVWAGADFRFGSGREGDIELLKKHFNTKVLDSICCSSGEVISSSRIRTLMLQGRHIEVERLLGWPRMHETNLDTVR